jgi:hypothetical protein
MLLGNIFGAKGRGLQFDRDAIRILRAAQDYREGVDSFAPFGRTRGRVNGLRGTYLRFDGRLADDFIVWVHRSAPTCSSKSAVPPTDIRLATC